MFCTKCGKEYSEDEKACSNCGAELNTVQPNQQSNDFGSFPTKKKNYKKSKIVGVLMFFVLSWIGLLIGLAIYHGEERSYFVEGWVAPMKWAFILLAVAGLITIIVELISGNI